MPCKTVIRNLTHGWLKPAAPLALLITVVLVLGVVPALTQNSVPPTAREAATLPQFASRLHPSTAPAMNRLPASGRTQRGRYSRLCDSRYSPSCGPPPSWTYENGPVNGTTDAWTINFGYIVSDTFSSSGSPVTAFDFYVWEFPGDTMTSVDWSITSAPNGGRVYGSGTATTTDSFISTNQYGYNIDKISVSGLNVGVTSGSTYWFNLSNASVANGDPVYWDENSGAGCHSSGCPSQASQSAVGTIPSEAFDITGNGGPPPPPPPPPSQCDSPQGIHDFTGQDGAAPYGVTMDKAGNLYGTTSDGGNYDGTAFKLVPEGQDWLFTFLYSFTENTAWGLSPAIVGPDGALYGAGLGLDEFVFRLAPEPTACLTALCGWTETELYRFTKDSDASRPNGHFVFDPAGNLYGTSLDGGKYGYGTVYQLTPSNGGWTERVVYSFPDGTQYSGSDPSGLLLGNDGYLYGTTDVGGKVFQLIPSGDNWIEKDLYVFNYSKDGIGDPGNLVQHERRQFLRDRMGRERPVDFYALTLRQSVGSHHTLPVPGRLLRDWGRGNGCGRQSLLDHKRPKQPLLALRLGSGPGVGLCIEVYLPALGRIRTDPVPGGWPFSG